jgi:hypothetical protein
MRKLAAQVADNGLAPELAAGIGKVKGAKHRGVRAANYGLLAGPRKEWMADSTAISQSYARLLASIKDRIQQAQVPAAVAVN